MVVKVLKEDVEFKLSNGTKLIANVRINGTKYEQVDDYKAENVGIWLGSDWDKLEEGQLSKEEANEFDNLVADYAESELEL